MKNPIVLTCPKGVESLLLKEAEQLGLEQVRESVGSVHGSGDLETAYRLLLWSRLASRLFWVLESAPVTTMDTLAAHLNNIDWSDHLRPSGTFRIQFHGALKDVRNEVFGAQKSKDVIVDQFRAYTGSRPGVSKERPDLVIDIQIRKGQARIALDLSGEPLHRRGYRLAGSKAPLKENLAAAILLRAGWPETAACEGALLDPMCGSGTFLVEAAMMAGDRAPGLSRQYYGFSGWLGHKREIWQSLLDDARQRRAAGEAGIPPLIGYDADPKAIRNATDNIERAGLKGKAFVYVKELAQWTMPTHIHLNPGLVITNPPYGVRLGEVQALKGLYRYLGGRVFSELAGWKATVLTGNQELGFELGERAEKMYRIQNGPIDCRILNFQLQGESHRKTAEPVLQSGVTGDLDTLADGPRMFANRLLKNRKKLKKWLKQNQSQAYRLYDADLPEYAVAVDIYGESVHVAEYRAPASIPEEKAQQRLADVMKALPVALGVDDSRIFLKERRRQSGTAQYQRLERQHKECTVTEHGVQLICNLSDFLDTGLFLDHRPVRYRIQKSSAGKRILNLFCYTGTATVHAAVGGARRTTSVDMSRTYLSWARRNLDLNGFSEAQHRLVEADCIRWLQEQKKEPAYELIFMDPPTFSNSKKMAGVLDIQADHAKLIDLAMGLLAPQGELIFSTNQRRFELDAQLTERYVVKDITRETIPDDFARTPGVHHCWTLHHRNGAQNQIRE